MRIIAGNLKGRQFDSPGGRKTHPMSEKLRSAIFNALGDITGLSVLDAYGGSGALGFEALSRGAVRGIMIEVDKHAHKTIETNARSLGLSDRLAIVRANASSWSARNPGHAFDLVFLDPPYDGIKLEALQRLSAHAKPGGVIVLSMPSELTPPQLLNSELLTTKIHGDAQLTFYRRFA